jgi:hypothetical protein
MPGRLEAMLSFETYGEWQDFFMRFDLAPEFR